MWRSLWTQPNVEQRPQNQQANYTKYVLSTAARRPAAGSEHHTARLSPERRDGCFTGVQQAGAGLRPQAARFHGLADGVESGALIYKHTAVLPVSSRENHYDKAGSVPSEPLYMACPRGCTTDRAGCSSAALGDIAY